MIKDVPMFSRGDGHDERVQVLLTADEYIFARDESKSRGLSTSAYLRFLLNNDRRLAAQKQLPNGVLMGFLILACSALSCCGLICLKAILKN